MAHPYMPVLGPNYSIYHPTMAAPGLIWSMDQFRHSHFHRAITDTNEYSMVDPYL
jgi:hypothetical protein